MPKRETCKWAKQFDHRNEASMCIVPLPPWSKSGRLVVMHSCCDHCPCWLAKDAPGPSVEARCPACGETWMSPAVLVPENDPAICIECMIELAGEKNDA